MAGDDKQIKITAAVDKTSFDIAKNSIKDLTREVQKLAEAMSKLGSGGGLFGGMSSKSGNFNASTQATKNIGGSALTQGIGVDAAAIAKVAKFGTDALKQISTGLKSSVSGQISDISRLEAKLKSLQDQYNKTGSAAALAIVGGGGFGGGGAGAGGGGGGAGGGPPFHGWVGGPENAPGNWNGVNKFFNQEVPNPWDMAKSLATGPFGMASATFYGGAKVYDAIASAGRETARTTAEYNLSQANAPGAQRAEITKAYSGMAYQIRNDINYRIAASKVRNSGALKDLVDEGHAALREKAENIDPGNFVSTGWGQYARTASGVYRHGLKVGVLNGTQNELGLATAKAQMAIPGQEAALIKDRLDNALNQITEQQKADRSYLWSGYQGRLSLEHTARTSRANELGLGTQWDAGEMAGMRQQLAGTAGSRFMGQAGGVLNLQAGGFNNAGQVFGAAAQFSGNPWDLMNTVTQAASGTGRRGYVDIAAASQIANIVSQEMLANASGSMGQAMSGTLAATQAFFPGAQGGNILSGQLMQRGLAQAGKINAGQTSPMQMAINAIAASNVYSNPYQQQYAMALTPLQEMNMMLGGAIPDELKTPGQSDEQIRANLQKFVNQREAGSFAGFRMANSTDPVANNIISKIRSTGDFYGTIKNSITGNSKEERMASFRQIAMSLGRAQAAGRGIFGAEGVKTFQMLEDFTMAKGGLLDSISGGDVGASSDRASRLTKKQQDQLIKDREDRLRQQLKEHPETFAMLSEQEKAELGKIEGLGAGNVSQAASKAAEALQALSVALKNDPNSMSPTKHKAAGTPDKAKPANSNIPKMRH